MRRFAMIGVQGGNGGGGSGGSALSSYPIAQAAITLNPDGLTFSVLDNLDVTVLSNGKQRYDTPTFPNPPSQTVENGFGRPIALWAYDNGTTIQYEWTYGIEVDLTGLMPPLNFATQQRPGAMLLGSGICINFSGSQKTIGSDSFNNYEDWRRQRFDTIYEARVLSSNPGYGLYVDGTARFTNRVEFRVDGPDGFSQVPVGNTVDESYCNGLVIPAGEQVGFKIVWVIGVIYIVPAYMNPQGVISLCTISITNNGGSDWTRGTDSLDDATLTRQSWNTIASGYIGSYADLVDLTASGIEATEGNTALIDGILHTYLDGTWVSGGGSAGNTFIAQTADDFTMDSGPVPVKLDSGQLRHIYKDYDSTSNGFIGGGFVYPNAIQIDQRTEVQIASNNNMFPDQIFLNVAVFDPMQGKLIPAGNGSYPITNVDTSLPPTGLRVIRNPEIGSVIAVGYVTLTGEARIATLSIPNNSTVVTLISDVLIESQVTAFAIDKSWNSDNDKMNVPHIIAYAGFTNATTQGFFGTIDMGYHYNLTTPASYPLPSYTTQSDWDGFMLSGMEAKGDGDCLIVLRSGSNNIILVNPRSGTVIDDDTIGIVGTSATSMKYIQDKCFCLMEAKNTLDIVATVIDTTGATITVTTPVGIASGITNIVTDQYSCDIGVFHNWNGFDNTVLEFVVCTDDGAGARTFEIFQAPYVGNVIGATTDTASVTNNQSATVKHIHLSTYRDDEVEGTRTCALRYVNNNTEAFSLYQFTSRYQSTQQLEMHTRSMPQHSECLGMILGGVGIGDTVTVYAPGSQIALSGANGWYYASANGREVSTTPSNLRLGYGVIGSNVMVVTLDTPEEKEFIHNGSSYPLSLVTSYLLYGQQSIDFDMGTFPLLYTPIITVMAMSDNCSLLIDNYDLSCTEMTNMGSTINSRPSLFSKKGSYVKIQRVFDRCDAGWIVIEDGRNKDISIVIDPSNADQYDTNFLYMPRKYNGHKKIEFGNSTPATSIIEKVFYDEQKVELLQYLDTSMQIDFTTLSLPPDNANIVGPVVSTTFTPANKGNIILERMQTNNLVSSIWKQTDANEYN